MELGEDFGEEHLLISTDFRWALPVYGVVTAANVPSTSWQGHAKWAGLHGPYKVPSASVLLLLIISTILASLSVKMATNQPELPKVKLYW